MNRARALIALAVCLAPCLGLSQTASGVLSGMSSAELIQHGETDIIVNKELAGYSPFVHVPLLPGYLSKIRVGLNTFAGYGVETKNPVTGLSGLLSGPIGGSWSWDVGYGFKVDLTQQLTIASFSFKNSGPVLGFSLSFD